MNRSAPERQTLYEFGRMVLIATTVVALVVLLLMFFWHTVWVLLLVFAAILLAVALRALADMLGSVTGLRGGWSLLALLVTILAVGITAGFLMAPNITEQAEQLSRQLPQSLQTVQEWLEGTQWGQWLLYWSPPSDVLEAELPRLVWEATGILYSTIGAIFAAIIVIFVGIYVAVNPALYTAGILRLTPMTYRPRMAEILGVLGVTLRRWLLGQFIAMIYVGIATFVGLWMLDVPMALLLAILAFALEFIPNFGPIIATVPAVLIAFVESPEKAVWVLALYIVVQQVESYVITPLVQRRTVSLPPVLTITSQLLLVLLVGPLGLLLATPLMAVALVLVKMLYVEDTLGDRIRTPELELAPEDTPALPEPDEDEHTRHRRLEIKQRIEEESERQSELKERYQREQEEAEERGAKDATSQEQDPHRPQSSTGGQEQDERPGDSGAR